MSDVPRSPRPDGAGVDGVSRPALPNPSIEGPSGEVEHPAGSARIPGARRDGYTKLPTGPVGIEPVIVSGPVADDVAHDADWEPATGASAVDDTRLAPWALMAAIVALASSFFVGWGIPIAVVAVIASIMSLRRPVESRAIARWALVLGLCATVYSLGWLVWAGMQFERLG
ncbi:hypothetical protein JOF42_001397 [Microbacterium phyllosphaerae]|uniref:DUF4190 domain-containing protein n=1 Tax=Microbacterium phyllosphaerae TaxID=124798 RepID=A0ABS4WNW6_9MICO|nr:hypothetical protein [Microbacterium phyllosphaerae]MBP2377902.1 hypothetical protein [Microbacterium phyllosphaerae]MCS3442107.1 hypothetical protein [Microbacterium phyllosphaerae]